MKRIVLSSAVVALAIAGMGVGSAEPAVHKITGGGQLIAVGATGPGDTVAFTAQSLGAETADGSNAKGQFQLQDRGAPLTGNTEGEKTFHGEVTCAIVTQQPSAEQGGIAVLGGKLRDGRSFRVDVLDDGQGGDALDMLRVAIGRAAEDGADNNGDNPEDTQLCDSESEQADNALGRGNVKIHKEKAANNGGGKGQG